jgi:hypothetical protein
MRDSLHSKWTLLVGRIVEWLALAIDRPEFNRKMTERWLPNARTRGWAWQNVVVNPGQELRRKKNTFHGYALNKSIFPRECG